MLAVLEGNIGLHQRLPRSLNARRDAAPYWKGSRDPGLYQSLEKFAHLSRDFTSGSLHTVPNFVPANPYTQVPKTKMNESSVDLTKMGGGRRVGYLMRRSFQLHYQSILGHIVL